MIEKNIMKDFTFSPQNDGTLEMRHEPCRLFLKQSDGVYSFANLAEAYEAAENHLLNLCPGR